MKLSLSLGSLVQKSSAVLLLLATVTWIFPQSALGASPKNQDSGGSLVFDAKQKDELQKNFTGLSYEEVYKDSAEYKLEVALKEFLEQKGSPLAQCSDILVKQNNWKKILALANAESGLGKKYPKSLNNLWGVGGANLWKMGNNICEGVVSMNNFLNAYPKKGVKYSEMSYKKMNGFYKQPAAPHWEKNIYYITDALEDLEQEILKEEQNQTPPVQLSLAF